MKSKKNCISLSDISFVIPTNREKIYTIESIPEECEIVISHAKPLGAARNDGIARATRNWIILCDDDIEFSEQFLGLLCELAEEHTIIGLEGYYPSPFVIGRLMMFAKSAWIELGGFDERAHGDETEWQMRAIEHGYNIVRLSRSCVYHYPHKKVKPKTEFGNILYLLRNHPKFPLYVLKLVLVKLHDSSYNEEYIRR